MNNHRILLVIMDGVGYNKNPFGNAVYAAKTPNLDKLYSMYPTTLIHASGKYVGLPNKQMGNSEVGHLNIGAGRIVYTGLSLINKTIKEKMFNTNPAFIQCFNYVKNHHSKLHLIGLVSHGGVHSSYDHLIQLMKTAYKNKIEPIIHIITDGRDVDPKSFINDLKDLNYQCKKYHAKIGSISGRYYAMDRDQRWNRIELAYNNLIGQGNKSFTDLNSYVKDSYVNNVTDEFIVPAFNASYDLNQIKISNNDGVIFFNFRPDRARQMSHCIFGSKLYKYEPKTKLQNINFVIMSNYEGINPTAIAFPPMELNNVLGKILEINNLKQLRIAETEKYAHVTFFFDGGKMVDYKNETKILIPSPKVATYDLKPSMSTNEITEKLINELNKNDVIICNYANGDMVGHTGVFNAAVKAIECVDLQIGKLYQACLKNRVTMMITADHGNAENMLTKDYKPITKHTTNPVKLVITDKDIKLKNNGKLSNIAPTILDYLGIKIPKEMDEPSLIKK